MTTMTIKETNGYYNHLLEQPGFTQTERWEKKEGNSYIHYQNLLYNQCTRQASNSYQNHVDMHGDDKRKNIEIWSVDSRRNPVHYRQKNHSKNTSSIYVHFITSYHQHLEDTLDRRYSGPWWPA